MTKLEDMGVDMRKKKRCFGSAIVIAVARPDSKLSRRKLSSAAPVQCLVAPKILAPVRRRRPEIPVDLFFAIIPACFRVLSSDATDKA